MQNLKNITK